MTTTFISYKSEHRPFAQKVRDFLRALGHQTWFDADNIRKGEYFRDEIQKGLESAQTVIGIVTPEALQSREVLTEWDFAFSSKGAKRLLLLRYHPAELPYWLKGVQYIDFVGDEKSGFEQLKQALNQPDISDYAGESPSDLARRMVSPIVYRPPADGKITIKDPEKRDREQILYNLYQSWITGVLYKNTEHGLFTIKSQLRADAVLKTKDYTDYKLPDGSIGQIFEDMNGQLLILGKPGAGKTILLLQLAETLLGQAQADDKQPMPLVFNLSSWATKQGDLGSWLADEMRRNYGIPKKNGKNRLERNQIILLLDGLDEVAESARDACVDAINAYREGHKNLKIAVCSRIADYEALTKKLDVNGAILLDDLSDEQIENYLAGDEHIGTRELIEHEPIAKGMAQTPFLLSAMKSAYQGAPYTGNPHKQLKLGDDSLETRRDHLMGGYVDERLTREPNSTRHFLGWMAWQMRKHERILLNIEDFQPHELLKHLQIGYRKTVRLNIGLSFGLFTGLIFGLSFGLFTGLIFGLSIGLLGGIFSGMFDGLSYIGVSDKLRWSFTKDHLTFGIIGGLSVILIGGLGAGLSGGLSGGLGFTLIIGVSIFLTVSEDAETRHSPNQGIKRSAINGLMVGIIVGLLSGLSVGLIGGLAVGLIVGITIGLIGLLSAGGETLIKHTTLRIILWRAKLAPLNYAKFLIHCSELGLLRQVGGGFIFRHRYLQEYFAQEWEKANQTYKP